MTITTAMILAAGFGTRMRPLTDTCPKPMLAVAGRPMIDHALDHVAQAGLTRAVINLHYLGEMIRAHLADRTRPALSFSPEETLLDTGGGIARALPLLGAEAFVTLNSDAIWAGRNPVETLLSAWQPQEASALMLLVPGDRALSYTRAGDFFLDGDRPVPRGDRSGAPYVYTGAQIIAHQAFKGVPDGAFPMWLVWERLFAEGRVRAVIHEDTWVDVGTPAGLRIAEEALG